MAVSRVHLLQVVEVEEDERQRLAVALRAVDLLRQAAIEEAPVVAVALIVLDDEVAVLLHPVGVDQAREHLREKPAQPHQRLGVGRPAPRLAEQEHPEQPPAAEKRHRQDRIAAQPIERRGGRGDHRVPGLRGPGPAQRREIERGQLLPLRRSLGEGAHREAEHVALGVVEEEQADREPALRDGAAQERLRGGRRLEAAAHLEGAPGHLELLGDRRRRVAHALPCPARSTRFNPSKMSIGIGKMIVEFFSAAISVRVWR